MNKLDLRERLRDPKSPEGRPRRAAYILPSLFTAANLFLGFLSIVYTFRATVLFATGLDGSDQFSLAAILIGVAVFADGLDGRIARVTNTVSDFGREADSLADVITFGVAPAVLAFAWGVEFVILEDIPQAFEHLRRMGYFAGFVFLVCGAARLARFNIQTNPIPKNPGRPDRKYFVGLAIPAAAGTVAAIVFAAGGEPIRWWLPGIAWLLLLFLLSFLMVSTWRYASMKDVQLLRPRSPLTLVGFAVFIYLMWSYTQVLLLLMAVLYVGSGIFFRMTSLMRRRTSASATPAEPPASTP